MAPTHVLLVEGPNDSHFFYQLLKSHKFPISETKFDEQGRIKIIPRGGIDTLLDEIPTWIKSSELVRMGVIVDNDAEAVHADPWQSILNSLSRAGYTNLPIALDPGGATILSPGLPTIGVWLVPDNVQHGMLEDLARQLIPTEDRLWDRVETCVEAIPADERLWKPSYTMKAKMHTWLAWQEEPDARLGLAIKQQVLKADTPLIAPLIAWLHRTFDL